MSVGGGRARFSLAESFGHCPRIPLEAPPTFGVGGELEKCKGCEKGMGTRVGKGDRKHHNTRLDVVFEREKGVLYSKSFLSRPLCL